jgi:microcystin-dependent protein
MALPAFLRRLYSFTAFQQSQGDNSFPGTQLDTELDQIDNTVTGLLEQLGGLLRPDGKLVNGIVTRNSLSADLTIGVGAARPWKSTVPYLDGETVTRGYLIYQAIQASLGVDPAADVNGTTWEIVADLSQAVTIAAGGVVTASIADGAVTNAKLAGGITGDKLVDATIPPGKIQPGLGVVPVGARIGFAGITPPAGWAFENGAAVSRQTYAALFAAITLTFKADVTIGQTVLANPSRSIQGLGLGAAYIEGPGIPLGSRLANDADGNLQLNAAATGTAAQATIRVCPYGNGDGATTFNLPDSRGRADFGRDNMGGAGAGRLTQTVDGSALTNGAFDAGAGAERATIGINNLPTTLPGGKVTVTYPNYNTPTYGLLQSLAAGGGSIPIDGLWRQLAPGQSVPAEAAREFNVAGAANPGGSQPFNVLPPASITNKIIFHGVL